MTTITTPIIPIKQTFAKVDAAHQLHLEAICVFVATGFFLDRDTYWKDQVVLPPASNNSLNDSGGFVSAKPWFTWHYTPRELTFEQALEAFADLFETIIAEQTQNKNVILPLSGGLDSRTQAVAFKQLGTEAVSYSYEFMNGYPETRIAHQIAKAFGFGFTAFTIPKGYLWNSLDTLAELNGCYSDFTNPRQMAIYGEFPKLGGELFSLGHWGDVLFDDMKVPDDLPLEQQVEAVLKKIVKQGGLELAEHLWASWNLEGRFYDYFRERISQLLKAIDIPHSANARIRAFKSLYWAPRWTSVNLAIFEASHPIALPYYDDRMCEFICTVPEAYLKNRRLQIAYVKTRAPELARITWQDHRPFNLYHYHKDRMPYNLSYRVVSKAKRVVNSMLGNPYVMRNWELQFLGKSNENRLKEALYNDEPLNWIPKPVVDDVVTNFYKEPEPKTAHPLTMLLVLAKFSGLDASTSSA